MMIGDDLAGKKALVTGASGGLGQAIARILSSYGVTVVASGTREAVLKDLVASLPQAAVALPCALDDATQVNALWSQAEEAVGPIDILVNNAGLTADMLLIRMKDEDWDRVIQVNLTSVFQLCRHAVKSMMKRKQGRIIQISSVVGVMGNPGQANYTASKAGLIGFSKSLAQEVASRGITVNCIAPGFIASPMTDVLPEAHKDKLLSQIPMGRMGSPEDIAQSVAFLSSQASAYITGQTLHVNGGMVMI